MGYGAGSALTVYPIANMIKGQGYEAAFFKFGLAQGLVIAIVGWWLKPAPANAVATGKARIDRAVEVTPMQMLRSPAFWVMYVMFVLTATGGLIATAQVKPIATDFGLGGDALASLGTITVVALPFALAMSRVLNGFSRFFFGWVSDHLGRERTMAGAFVLEGLSFLLLNRYGASPTAFVATTGLIFFAYGEIYSLFPAACGDWYGKKYASANAGLLYTAKGTASLIVPLTSVLAASFGGWSSVFLALAGMNLFAALLAIFVLRPLRPDAIRSGVAAPVLEAMT